MTAHTPLANFVAESAPAPGTGPVQLAGATTGGYRRFRDGIGMTDGTTVFYVIRGNVEGVKKFEAGSGVLTYGDPDTISRDNVWDDTDGGGVPVNFDEEVLVFCSVPAFFAIYGNDQGFVDKTDFIFLGASFRGAAEGAGYASVDASTSDQAGTINFFGSDDTLLMTIGGVADDTTDLWLTLADGTGYSNFHIGCPTIFDGAISCLGLGSFTYSSSSGSGTGYEFRPGPALDAPRLECWGTVTTDGSGNWSYTWPFAFTAIDDHSATPGIVSGNAYTVAPSAISNTTYSGFARFRDGANATGVEVRVRAKGICAT